MGRGWTSGLWAGGLWLRGCGWTVGCRWHLLFSHWPNNCGDRWRVMDLACKGYSLRACLSPMTLCRTLFHVHAQLLTTVLVNEVALPERQANTSSTVAPLTSSTRLYMWRFSHVQWRTSGMFLVTDSCSILFQNAFQPTLVCFLKKKLVFSFSKSKHIPPPWMSGFPLRNNSVPPWRVSVVLSDLVCYTSLCMCTSVRAMRPWHGMYIQAVLMLHELAGMSVHMLACLWLRWLIPSLASGVGEQACLIWLDCTGD